VVRHRACVPDLVLEKIVVYFGGTRMSYLGPLGSVRVWGDVVRGWVSGNSEDALAG